MDWILMVWLVVALHLVLVLVMAACAFGAIGVNNFAGMRTPSVMKSARSWRRGHRSALVPMLITVGFSIWLAVLSSSGSLPIGDDAVTFIELALVLVGTIAGGMAATLSARKSE